MKFNFKNKNIFISGGTHGIGLECSIHFAKLGANIISFSRDEKKINNMRKKLKKFKRKNLIEVGDILDKNFVDDFPKEVLKRYKNVDILIHNVGGGGRWGEKDFLKSENHTWEDVYNKNNYGLINFTRDFLPGMVKKKWGRVIVIGSTSGIEAKLDDRPWFNSAKASQRAIIKSLSKKEYASKNITFNLISPGPIMIKDTGWDSHKRNNFKDYKKFIDSNIPLKKIGTPEDVASLCLFISSNYASYINGANFVIDGGMTSNI